MRLSSSLLAVALGAVSTGAISLDLTSTSSIKSASAQIAYDMMTFYTGNQSGIYNIPGMLPASPAYYWWEAGAMWGTLIDYWHITGDTSYNPATIQGMLFQVGPYQDYMPPNQSKQLGNDDQGFWGMAAMTAAEYNFENPPVDQPQWLALAQAVFNEYTMRWDTSSCNGGLRWQIFSFNAGYDYKNAIANGCLFNLGARLSHYTGNTTYSDWAYKAWDWCERIGLIDKSFNIYDGTDDSAVNNLGVPQNCTTINHLQYSYNPGVWLLGAANMYASTNGTEQALWQTRVQGIYNTAISYFSNDAGIFIEQACETQTPITCNTDMLTFKGILVRNMAAASKLAPFIADSVKTVIAKQAAAAAQQCTGGANGHMCGFKWTGAYDGTTGAGQEMSALQAVMNTMIASAPVPVTNSTGGTSTGKVNAGNPGTGATTLATPLVVGTADRAGAGIITAIVLFSAVVSVYWMVTDETSRAGTHWYKGLR